MVDINTDQVIDFFKSLNPDQVKDFFEKFVTSSPTAKQAIAEVGKGMSGVGKIIQDVKANAEQTYERLKVLSTIDFSNFIAQISNGNKELLIMGAQIAAVGVSIAAGIKPDAFNAMGESASGMNNNLSGTLDTLDKIAKISPLSGLTGIAISSAKALSDLAEPAKKLEFGFLAAAASSGELKDLLADVGEDLTGLEAKSVSYADILYHVGNATGYNTEQVGKYAAELAQVPGAMSSWIDIAGDGTEMMHQLQAEMQLAAGSGKTFSDVQSEIKRVFMEFGTSGKESLEVFSRLSAVSQSLKLPFDLVKDYLQTTSGSFRMFGDNSQAALNILEKFGPALKEGGLGPKAIADLTQSVTRNVAEMGLAQRAFLSATSGGPGGLQGSYQIELMKKQGKTDDVEKLVEDSLKRQFGGKILTLEDAAKDASSAAQFAKQVQLITQGPTKIANSEGEAYRILEAMSKGTKAGPMEKTTAEGSLNDVMAVGNSIQERNYNQLVNIGNQIERQTQYAAITANSAIREVAGTGIGAKTIERTRIEATEQAASKAMIIGQGTQAKPVVEMGVQEAIRRGIETLPSSIDNMKKLADEMMSGAKNSFQDQKDKLKDSILFQTNQQRSLPDIGSAAQQVDQTQSAKSTETTTTIVPIEIVNVCPNCNKEAATEIAVKVVDGKIAGVEKDRAMHVHTGVSGIL